MINASRLFAIAFALCVVIAPVAVADTQPSTVLSGAAQPPLPACIDSEPAIADIKRALVANSANSKKYDGYRKWLPAESDVVLAARLAYAETLAANCAEHTDEVLDLVASVIGNRVRIRHGDVKDVVFQRNQFASSLHVYSESRYREFLCPSDAALWQKSLARMQSTIERDAPIAPVPSDAVNYYLYRHSARFAAPDWMLQEARVGSEEVRSCIRVFRDAGWR